MKEQVHEGEESKYTIPLLWDKYDPTVREFEINQDYLGEYESSIVDSVDLFLRISQKQISGSIELSWFLDGVVTLECDACLESVSLGIRAENTYYVKQHPKGAEGSKEVDLITVLPGENYLDLGDLISENIHINIPIQVTCSMDAYTDKECNPDVIKYISGYDDEVSDLEDSSEEEESNEEHTDPRWEALKKIQFKNTEDGTSET